jgi:sugar lactone lactonase YvrE
MIREKAFRTVVIGLIPGMIGAACSQGGGGSSGPSSNLVLQQGMIGTYTGDGLPGGAGGEGKALTESRLYNPMELLFAGETLYIVDWNNHRIRRVATDGTLETVIGSEAGFPGEWPCQNPSHPMNCEIPLDGAVAGDDLLLNHPMDLVPAPDGTLYLAAWHNHKIERYDPESGLVTILAGRQSPGFTGDGGPAAEANLNFPSSIVMDAAGNLLVSDERNNRVRRIANDPNRTITTIAGASSPPTASGYGGDNGPAAAALLALTAPNELGGSDNPPPGGGLAMDDDGNLYIADTFNHCIRKVAPGADGILDGDAEEIITTAAGKCGESGPAASGVPLTAARFNTPFDLEFGPDGRLYVSDTANNVVRAMDFSTGLIETVAGTGEAGFSGDEGPAASAQLSAPYGIEFDESGNLYIADTLNNRIRIVCYDESCTIGLVKVGGGCEAGPVTWPSGPSGIIATFAGTGDNAFLGDGCSADQAAFSLPMDMTLGPDGRMYISDWNNHRVRVVDADYQIATVAGTGFEGDACELPNPDGTCPAVSGELNHMTDVTFDSAGRMVIAAWHNSKIKRVDFSSGLMIDLCGTGNRKFEGDGGPCEDENGVDLVSFDLPSGVVYDPEGNLILSDQANQVIRRIGTDGIVKIVAGNCPGTPGFGCFDGQGYEGDGGPATLAKLNNELGQGTDPQGKITMDADGNLLIADTGNNAIRIVTPGPDGIIGGGDPSLEIISTIAGTGTAGYSGDDGPAAAAMLNGPRDVAIASDGVIYLADTRNNCVRKIAADGVITTGAGRCGEPGGFAGDGGPADLAALNKPYGIALDSAGNLYIADTLNNRIRVVFK